MRLSQNATYRWGAMIIAMALSPLDQLVVRAAESPCKQPICHHNNGKNEWNTLEVACRAVSSHLEHGDLVGPCEEQPCADLCVHEACQNDYQVLDDGTCDCDSNPVPIVCGDGAMCDITLDECVCWDETQSFDGNGNCVDICQPAGVAFSIDLTFKDDDFSQIKVKTVAEGATRPREEVISGLAQDFPELFGLAGTSCHVTVKDLDLIDLPTGSESSYPWNGLCLTRYKSYLTHYGPLRSEGLGTRYTIEAVCDSDNELLQEYFQSFANKKEIFYFDDTDSNPHYASSDLNFFRIQTQQIVGSAQDEDGSCTSAFAPFYDLMRLDLSVSMGGCWGCATDPSPEPAWLPGGVFLTCDLIPPGLLESESSDPFSLLHNPEKDINHLDRDGVFIYTMYWQAKLFNSIYLSDLDMAHDEFLIGAHVDAIHVDPGNSCGL